jgi:hypothetical protein
VKEMMTMDKDQTAPGAEFTAEEIALFESDAAEAERGYSVEHLDSLPKLRLRGRPLELGDAAGVMVRLRIDPARLRSIDARAEERHVTRSQFIRDALDRELAST